MPGSRDRVGLDGCWAATTGLPPADGPFDVRWLLRHSTGSDAGIDPTATVAWWAVRGAERMEIATACEAPDAGTLHRFLGIGFPAAAVASFRAHHAGARLDMRLALCVVRARRPAQ